LAQARGRELHGAELHLDDHPDRTIPARARALRLKGVIAARARDRQRGGQGGVLLDPNLDQAKGRTLEAVANAAGVSHGTLHKVEVVERDAPEPVKVARLTGEFPSDTGENPRF